MQEQYIFLASNSYSFIDKDGKQITGAKVYLAPVRQESKTDSINGARPSVFNVSLDEHQKVYSNLEYLKTYEFGFSLASSARGAVTLRLNGSVKAKANV